MKQTKPMAVDHLKIDLIEFLLRFLQIIAVSSTAQYTLALTGKAKPPAVIGHNAIYVFALPAMAQA